MIYALAIAAVAILTPAPASAAPAAAVADSRKQVRLAFETEATKAALAKVTKLLDIGKPGRSCDPDEAMLTCEMEDGRSISVQAVPAKTTKAEAADLCVNPFASEPQKTTVELKGGDKQAGYVLLWCTDKATPSLKAAAERRIASAKEEAAIAKAESNLTMIKADALGDIVRIQTDSWGETCNRISSRLAICTTKNAPQIGDRRVLFADENNALANDTRVACQAVLKAGGIGEKATLSVATLSNKNGSRIFNCVVRVNR